MKQLLRIVCLVLLLSHVHLMGQQPASGGIAGIVTGEDKSPLSGILVTYMLIPPPMDGTKTLGGMVTAADGQFAFQGLQPGVYMLCARAAPADSVQDSCEWIRPAPTVTVTAGQDLTGVSVVLMHGERLRFRVNDATQVLSNSATGKIGAGLLAAVIEPSGFLHVLPLRSFDGTGQDLELTVPAGMLFQVTLVGSDIIVQDSLGSTLPTAGSAFTAQIATGTGPLQLTFSVQPIPVSTPVP